MTPSPQPILPLRALALLHESGFTMGEGWNQAHAICQQAEGTFAYDLVHALCHWIEGDPGNRDYWYRRVGPDWKRAQTIEEEYEKISQRLQAASPGGGVKD